MTTTNGIACVWPAQALEPGHLHPSSLPQVLEPWASVPVPSSANGDIPPKVSVTQGLDTGKGSVNTGSVRVARGISLVSRHLLIDYLLKTYYVPDTEQELVLRLTRPSRSSPRSYFLIC